MSSHCLVLCCIVVKMILERAYAHWIILCAPRPHPLLPFVAARLCRCVAVYVFVSNRLFHLTNELKDRIVPHDDNPRLARNCIQTAIAATAAVGAGWFVQRVLVLQMM
jgi:hypothetical protein